jgi:hypothetical protein
MDKRSEIRDGPTSDPDPTASLALGFAFVAELPSVAVTFPFPRLALAFPFAESFVICGPGSSSYSSISSSNSLSSSCSSSLISPLVLLLVVPPFLLVPGVLVLALLPLDLALMFVADDFFLLAEAYFFSSAAAAAAFFLEADLGLMIASKASGSERGSGRGPVGVGGVGGWEERAEVVFVGRLDLGVRGLKIGRARLAVGRMKWQVERGKVNYISCDRRD